MVGKLLISGVMLCELPLNQVDSLTHVVITGAVVASWENRGSATLSDTCKKCWDMSKTEAESIHR